MTQKIFKREGKQKARGEAFVPHLPGGYGGDTEGVRQSGKARLKKEQK